MTKKTLILIARREDAAQYVGTKWRFNTATLTATKPGGDTYQFIVVGKDGAWMRQLRGQVFDEVKSLELAPAELRAFVLSRVRPRSDG